MRSDPIDAADCAHLSDPVAGAAYRFQPDLEQLASGSGPISRKVQVIRSGNRRHRFSFGKVGREIGEDEAGHGPARLDCSARDSDILGTDSLQTHRWREVDSNRLMAAQSPLGHRHNTGAERGR